ncbi:uncharacterized protein LOC135479239 [Liolophura sinensis]|uniref:uncharacterized protein LOC135479239 n=3 Tax=Liolophura sinensis TaxID=3198878 RepID=UPI0031587B50
MAAGSNFNLLPQEISTDYFGDANVLTKRAKERGYNFFVNGYVHALKVNSSSKNIVDISAKCYRSMRKSEQPHRIDMTIHTQERRITDSHCSCKAGITGLCSHAVSVVYTVGHYKRLGLKDIPSQLACTSLPQQWHKPRGPKINAEPVAAIVFAKPRPTPRRKRPVCCSTPTLRIPELKEDDIKKLKVDKSTPLSYLLQDELHTEKTEYGIVQKGSMLPLQLPDSCNHGEHIQLRID